MYHLSKIFIGDYRFGFQSQEKDNEIYGNGNALSFEYRIQDPRLGKWFSIDPAAKSYPSISPYNYTLNNPLRFIDIKGKWVGEVVTNENGVSYVVFKAEKGDNISTLEMQLGLPKGTILNGISKEDKAILNNPNEGSIIQLQNLEVVQNINGYLNRADIVETNCSNAALDINGVCQENAWKDNGDGVAEMDQAENIVSNEFRNVPESESKIGDIVTYTYSLDQLEYEYRQLYDIYKKQGETGDMDREAFGKYAAKQHLEQFGGSPDHYSIVLLKDQTGQSVQQVFEKPGQGTPRVRTHTGSEFEYTPKPIGDEKNITNTKN